YVVPTGKVKFIVSAGRPNMVPAGRTIVSPGSIIFGLAKYSTLNHHHCLEQQCKVSLFEEGLKRTGRDRDGRVIILPPTTTDEHIAVQRESKARTTLLQSIPDDHVADFHYMDDARDIWNAVKARFGGNAESKKMRKSMLKQEFSEFRISESEGLHKGGLPSSWSQVALTLKTKGGLELLSFDDLYYKLKTLEIDIKGYSTHSSSQSPSHSAFVSTTSTSKKMSYAESPSFSSSTTYSAPSSSKARSHSSGNVLQDVLHSLVAESEPEQQVAYEDFEQIDKLDLEEMDIKWQMAMLSVRVNKFEKKAGRKIEFDKKEAARFNKKAVRCYKCLQKGHFARECRAKGGNEKRYSSFKIQELGKKEADTKALITVDTLENWKEHESGDDEGFAPKEYGMVAGCGAACEEGAAEVYSLITGNGTDAAAGEFALMGMTSEVQAYKNSLKTLEKQKRVYQQNQLGYEEKIRVLSIELENTTNLLKHSERINVEAEIAKKDLQTKLDNHLAKTEKWTSSSKNLPNWNIPFELMCDESNFAVGAVLGQKDGTYFHPIYFVSKTLNAAQQKHMVTEKELMAVAVKSLSREGSNKWYQSLLRVSLKKNIPGFKILINLTTKHLYIPLKWQDLIMIAMMLVFIVNPPFLNNNETFNLKSLPLSQTTMQSFLIDPKAEYRVNILPPTTADDHIVVQRRIKGKTTLLQSIPDDHNAEATKDSLTNSMPKPEDEDINLKSLELCLHHGLRVALTLKNKRWSKPTLHCVNNHYARQKDVISRIIADTEPEQQLAYEDFDQIEKLDLEEMDLK
ncbi:putative ribonuclease H-like domain-containing protein, partial [Tanacetum coccineum]